MPIHVSGLLETREYIAKERNLEGGIQITADNILFFNGLGDAISKVYTYLNSHSLVINEIRRIQRILPQKQAMQMLPILLTSLIRKIIGIRTLLICAKKYRKISISMVF